LEKNLDFVTDPRTGTKYHPGVTEAIAEVFGVVRQENGFWCVERSGEEWRHPVFQSSNLEIPTHLQHAVETPYGTFNGYDFFQLRDVFVAYPIDDSCWFQNRLVESSLEGLVLLLDAIGRIDKEGPARLIESRNGFNIVSFGGKGWVVDQAVGKVDFRDEEQLRSLVASGQLIETPTLGHAKATLESKVVCGDLARMESRQLSLMQRLAECERSQASIMQRLAECERSQASLMQRLAERDRPWWRRILGSAVKSVASGNT
jgi:hypothetical protein